MANANNGNSGIFINVQEKPEFLNTYSTGPEYQLLGIQHMDYNVPTKRPASLYGFTPPINTVEVKPMREWNSSTIIQKDGIVAFLNGVKTIEEDFTSTAWKQKLKTLVWEKSEWHQF